MSFPIPKFVQPFSSSMFIPWIFNGIESSDYRSINRTGFLGNLTVKLPQVLLLIPSMVFASPWADTLPSFQLKYSVVVLRVTAVHWHPLLHADQHGDGRSDISKRGFLFTKLTLANVFLVAYFEQTNWFHQCGEYFSAGKFPDWFLGEFSNLLEGLSCLYKVLVSSRCYFRPVFSSPSNLEFNNLFEAFVVFLLIAFLHFFLGYVLGTYCNGCIWISVFSAVLVIGGNLLFLEFILS